MRTVQGVPEGTGRKERAQTDRERSTIRNGQTGDKTHGREKKEGQGMQRQIRKILSGFIAVLILAVLFCAGFAEGYEPTTEDVWVLCQPDSFVYVRERPNGRSQETGYADCGDVFETDGVRKNGFLRVYANTEAGEGWISLGYIVWEKPVRVFDTRRIDSSGRVNARRTVNGKRRCWLKDGDEIKVYWMAEWAVTNKGFVKAEYIGAE